MTVTETLKQTPLSREHDGLHAKMVPFGGWLMPLQYSGILSEYEAARRGTAVFDTCHMGEFLVEGDARQSGLEELVTQPLADLPVGHCRYGMLLNAQGGVMDDLIVYRLAAGRWMIVVNGATMDKDAAHMGPRIRPPAQFHNISDQTAKIDVQGPRSRELLAEWLPALDKLAYFTCAEFTLFGERVIVSRTGYTGELGFEIYLPWASAPRFWQALLGRGVIPAGLGARDVLRLEMGYSLYGHELTETVSPLEAGLSRFIGWEKDFIGKEALLKQKSLGVSRELAAFVSETRRSPRSEQGIFSTEGEPIGVVTSGTFSPALKRGIGLGFIAGAQARKGNAILIGDADHKIAAQISARTFYKQGSLKN